MRRLLKCLVVIRQHASEYTEAAGVAKGRDNDVSLAGTGAGLDHIADGNVAARVAGLDFVSLRLDCGGTAKAVAGPQKPIRRVDVGGHRSLPRRPGKPGTGERSAPKR